MALVQNPQEYDSKLPTNVRIIGELKVMALAESAAKGIPLAQIVNEALADRYNVKYNVLEARCKEDDMNEHSNS